MPPIYWLGSSFEDRDDDDEDDDDDSFITGKFARDYIYIVPFIIHNIFLLLLLFEKRRK